MVERDLEIRSGAKPLARTWRYRGSAIRNVRSAGPANDPFGMRNWQTPFWMRPKAGAVRFDDGSGTVYLANGVDEPEGREIVAWLTRRLPVSAAEGSAQPPPSAPRPAHQKGRLPLARRRPS